MADFIEKNSLELKLIRQEFSPTATIGSLYCNGLKIADTLEDTQRKLPKFCPNTLKGVPCKCPEKVYGETCIPAGHYKVVYRYSPKFGKKYPALENVPHFIGILIHAGANVGHTEGCILVGERVSGRERLRNQFSVSEKVKKLVREAIEAGKDVWITIE